MKVVLFCGGLGTRLREHSETIPKPLVTVGYRPIMWHLMRYYAHFGHKEFHPLPGLPRRPDPRLLPELPANACLERLRDVADGKAPHRTRHASDIEDWRITFVDTGMHANLGQRLLRVRQYLG